LPTQPSCNRTLISWFSTDLTRFQIHKLQSRVTGCYNKQIYKLPAAASSWPLFMAVGWQTVFPFSRQTFCLSLQGVLVFQDTRTLGAVHRLDSLHRTFSLFSTANWQWLTFKAYFCITFSLKDWEIFNYLQVYLK